MTEVPSLVSASLLSGAEKERRMGVGERENNEREMMQEVVEKNSDCRKEHATEKRSD